jgi:elongation factor G
VSEDPTLRVEHNPETNQTVLWTMGDAHTDVTFQRLAEKFGVEVESVAYRVPLRETFKAKVSAEGRHVKQSGGHGQFAKCSIEVEPLEPGAGFEFVDKVVGGAVPRQFIPSVEKGLRTQMAKGVLAGYPVVGLKAILVDGSYHPVDSSEMAFKLAANVAYKAGVPQAGPVLLEPIGSLKVLIPDGYTGDIMGELNKRRGRILGMNPADAGLQQVDAEVPMSEMYDFTTALRSMTQGRGDFSLEFSRYEQLPQNLEASVIEEAKALFEDR